MIQGGYYGLKDWLKLDPEYLNSITDVRCGTTLRDYCRWNGLDYDDPYDLLRGLYRYTVYTIDLGEKAKPWQHVVIDPKAMNDLALDAQM